MGSASQALFIFNIINNYIYTDTHIINNLHKINLAWIIHADVFKAFKIYSRPFVKNDLWFQAYNNKRKIIINQYFGKSVERLITLKMKVVIMRGNVSDFGSNIGWTSNVFIGGICKSSSFMKFCHKSKHTFFSLHEPSYVFLA